MKSIIVIALVFCFGWAAQADHHGDKMKIKGEMAEMNADAHMKMADHFNTLSVQHKALADCLKVNSDISKEKCKSQREALKATRKAGKEHRMAWKGKRKAMRDKMKGMKKKNQ